MNSFWIVMSHILMVEAPRLRTWYRTFKHMKLESKIHMPDLPNSICNENLSISTKKTNQNLWNMLVSKRHAVSVMAAHSNQDLSRWCLLMPQPSNNRVLARSRHYLLCSTTLSSAQIQLMLMPRHLPLKRRPKKCARKPRNSPNSSSYVF